MSDTAKPEPVALHHGGNGAFQLAAITAGTHAMTSRRSDMLTVAATALVLVLAILFGLDALGSRAPEEVPVCLGMLLGLVLLWLSYHPVARLVRRRWLKIYERHVADAGPTEIVLDARGCRTRSDLHTMSVPWSLVRQVIDVPGGLVVRTGIFLVPLADAALPASVDRGELKARIAAWRGEA